jgi:pimeloyl-ACP methyl ester carboxylesterase
LNNSINVSWGAVSGASYYRVVYRNLTTNVLYNSSNIDNKTTNTYFTIRDLQQGHQYRWQVIAYNSSGFSPNSNGSYFTYPVQNTYTPTPGTGITPVNPTPTSASSIVKILVTDKSGTPVPSQIIKVQGYNSFGAPIGTLKTYTTDTSGSILINKNDIDKNAAKINYYKEDMRACSGGICTGDKTELFVANKTVNSTYNLNNVDITNYPVILVPGIMGSTIDNPLSIVPRLGKYTNATSKTYDQSKLFLADASGEWKVNIIGNVANFLVDFTKGEELGWDLMIKKLERNGYINGKTIIICPYDWSADIPFIVNNYFNACVNKGLANTNKGKVDVIAHSMGGLVTRAYVQEVGKTNGKNIRKIAFLGTPHLGATDAYPVWVAGYVDKSIRNSRSLILSSFYRDRGYSVPQTPTQYANQNITFSSTVAVLPYDINSNLFTTTYLADNPSLVYDFLRKENALGLKALVPTPRGLLITVFCPLVGVIVNDPPVPVPASVNPPVELTVADHLFEES